jgi:hypothetical protein
MRSYQRLSSSILLQPCNDRKKDHKRILSLLGYFFTTSDLLFEPLLSPTPPPTSSPLTACPDGPLTTQPVSINSIVAGLVARQHLPCHLDAGEWDCVRESAMGERGWNSPVLVPGQKAQVGWANSCPTGLRPYRGCDRTTSWSGFVDQDQIERFSVKQEHNQHT